MQTAIRAFRALHGHEQPGRDAAGRSEVSLHEDVYLGKAVQTMRGDVVDESLLAHLLPLGWEHINLMGDYLWRSANRTMPTASMASVFARRRSSPAKRWVRIDHRDISALDSLTKTAD